MKYVSFKNLIFSFIILIPNILFPQYGTQKVEVTLKEEGAYRNPALILDKSHEQVTNSINSAMNSISQANARANAQAISQANARAMSINQMKIADINASATLTAAEIQAQVKLKAAYTEALKDNYTNVNIDLLTSEPPSYQYLIVKSVKGFGSVENTRLIVNVLKNSRTFKVVSLLDPNPTHFKIPIGLLSHRQSLFLDWSREAQGEFNRITNLVLSNSDDKIVFSAQYKNKSYQEILSSLLYESFENKKTKDEAIKEIKEAKELLDLNIITKKEYEEISKVLKPIILGKNNNENSFKKLTEDSNIDLLKYSNSRVIKTNIFTKPIENSHKMSKKNIGDSIEFVLEGYNNYGMISDYYNDSNIVVNYIDYQDVFLSKKISFELITGLNITSKGFVDENDFNTFKVFTNDKVLYNNQKIIFLTRGKYYKGTIIGNHRGESIKVGDVKLKKNILWTDQSNDSYYINKSLIKYINK
tara:strand:+ start:678 stop:2096 length:1419 start_codon:yes stop_codon:yes gene_type:complete